MEQKNLNLPQVSVVIVNYNGLRFLDRCLNTVLNQDYPNYEVIVVDNASQDGSADHIAQNFPRIKLIRSDRNLGFGAGNNLGHRNARGEYTALLNNDTAVEPDWLRQLVEVAEQDPKVGAVGSKILFYTRFLPVLFLSDTFIPRNRGMSDDGRVLSLKLGTDLHFDGTSYNKIFFETGFHGNEQDLSGRQYQWTTGAGRVFLPYQQEKPLELIFNAAAMNPLVVNVFVGTAFVGSVTVDENFQEYKLIVLPELVKKSGVNLINNAGSYRLGSGLAGDVGFGEVDRGRYEELREVNNLCGGSVLLKRKMLEDVGLFDERLFMYYEDTDLFWRAQKKGWKLLYHPRSVVRHMHAASSGEWSPFFLYCVRKNHFLIVLKNSGAREIFQVFLAQLQIFLQAFASLCLSILGGNFNRAAFKRVWDQVHVILSASLSVIPFFYAKLKSRTKQRG